MTIPDLSQHELGSLSSTGSREEWDAAAWTAAEGDSDRLNWQTPEGIEVPVLHDAESV